MLTASLLERFVTA